MLICCHANIFAKQWTIAFIPCIKVNAGRDRWDHAMNFSTPMAERKFNRLQENYVFTKKGQTHPMGSEKKKPWCQIMIAWCKIRLKSSPVGSFPVPLAIFIISLVGITVGKLRSPKTMSFIQFVSFTIVFSQIWQTIVIWNGFLVRRHLYAGKLR